MTPRPRWLGLARPTSTSSSPRMSRLAWSWRAITIPAGRRPAELVGRDRLVGEASATEVGEGRLAGLRRGQDRVIEGDGRVEDLAEARPTGVLALGPLVDLDAGLAGQLAERLREGQAVALHHEAEDVAAQPAAEAMPALASRRHDERGCLLPVERTQTLVGRARLLQADRLADHVDDRQLALDLGGRADRQTRSFAPPGPGARRRPYASGPPARSRTWLWACQVLTSPMSSHDALPEAHLSSPCQYPPGVSRRPAESRPSVARCG